MIKTLVKNFLILQPNIFKIHAKHKSNLLSNYKLDLGGLALKTGIESAPLSRAFISSSILSISGKVDIAQWPIRTKTILEIGIGTVIGTSLT